MRRRHSSKPLPATWLVGKKVRLRPIEPEDVAMLQRWINESPARRWLLARMPFSNEAEKQWAARVSVDPNTPTFVIQTLHGKDIGTIGLIVDRHRALFGISIFDQRYWGRGYGTDATITLIDGAFRTRPLQRIELLVVPDNKRAIRAYERAGFVKEGVLREYEYRDGGYHDIMLMSILHDDWLKRCAKP